LEYWLFYSHIVLEVMFFYLASTTLLSGDVVTILRYCTVMCLAQDILSSRLEASEVTVDK